MTKELIQEYTLKITQASRTGIIVVMYDLATRYVADAIQSHESGNYEEFKSNIRAAGRVINDLEGALDYNYEPATYLFGLYQLIMKKLSMVIVKNEIDGLDKVTQALNNLKEAFAQIDEKYDSVPVMGNTQEVYLGLTYGKGMLNENMTGDKNRGFSV